MQERLPSESGARGCVGFWVRLGISECSSNALSQRNVREFRRFGGTRTPL